MRVLREYMQPDAKNVAINHDSDKNLYMSGIFIQADVRNQNQRIYPLNEISNAVSSLKERLKNGESILGECDHPEELTINVDRVSHMITEMWMDGNNGCGKLRIVDTPKGKIIQSLLESGARLGVSSRGAGEVDYNGRVSCFEMITADIVAQPSAPDAYPKPIYESLYNMQGGKVIESMAEDALYAGHKDASNAEKHLKENIVDFIRCLDI